MKFPLELAGEFGRVTVFAIDNDHFHLGTEIANITVIPEPGSALLGGIGMLALLRRRR